MQIKIDNSRRPYANRNGKPGKTFVYQVHGTTDELKEYEQSVINAGHPCHKSAEGNPLYFGSYIGESATMEKSTSNGRFYPNTVVLDKLASMTRTTGSFELAKAQIGANFAEPEVIEEEPPVAVAQPAKVRTR